MSKGVFEKLEQDHKKVKKLFKEILDDDLPTSEREEIFSQIKTELLAHAEAEEKVFYPNFKKEEKTRDLTLEAAVEHQVAEDLVSQLDEEDCETDEWLAKCRVLCEVVSHHIEEEEDELFPKAKKMLDEKQSKDMAVMIEEEEESYKEALAS